jgi:hypothetical protein
MYSVSGPGVMVSGAGNRAKAANRRNVTRKNSLRITCLSGATAATSLRWSSDKYGQRGNQAVGKYAREYPDQERTSPPDSHLDARAELGLFVDVEYYQGHYHSAQGVERYNLSLELLEDEIEGRDTIGQPTNCDLA